MNFECFLKLMSEFDILSYCSHHLLFSGLVKVRGCQDQLERQVIDGKKNLCQVLVFVLRCLETLKGEEIKVTILAIPNNPGARGP